MKKWLLLFPLLVACASVQRNSPYDGVEIPETPADSATFVRLSIKNNRSTDATPPTFYLLGTGRHPIGVVNGLTEKSFWVDTHWFSPDGFMRVAAHYPGRGDWTSEEFHWRKGFMIDVRLESIMASSSAWAHR